MDYVKDAFERVKKDMASLKKELNDLREGLVETRERMVELCEIVGKIGEKAEIAASTHKSEIETTSTHPSTHDLPLEPLKAQNMPFSTGNEGASTDRQTDRQTHQQTQKQQENREKTPENNLKGKDHSFENALEILNSLDDIKKELRLKFKRLTEQEILIFSTIYQIEEEQGYANYKLVAEKLKLTESSVRDYVGRLIKKGIPVDKRRINNKQIHLFISQNLKKIAPLSTILQLRDL